MKDPNQRNYLEDWCLEGISIAEAERALAPTDLAETMRQFADAPNDEFRAAFVLHALTGLKPMHRDRGGLQGAADILLEDENEVQIVEVTSTIEERFARNQLQLEILVEDGKQTGQIMSVSWLWARADPAAEQTVSAASWSANIPGGDERPYLDRLTDYVATSALIETKCEKLRREGESLGSTRQHLYLLTAATGRHGGLLPVSPSQMTWGTFSPPPTLTDLWLDGGTGIVYHWAIGEGWRFHQQYRSS